MIIINFDFENAASHKYAVQKAKSLCMARSEMTGHSFLVLIQKLHSRNGFTTGLLLIFLLSLQKRLYLICQATLL